MLLLLLLLLRLSKIDSLMQKKKKTKNRQKRKFYVSVMKRLSEINKAISMPSFHSSVMGVISACERAVYNYTPCE